MTDTHIVHTLAHSKKVLKNRMAKQYGLYYAVEVGKVFNKLEVEAVPLHFIPGVLVPVEDTHSP